MATPLLQFRHGTLSIYYLKIAGLTGLSVSLRFDAKVECILYFVAGFPPRISGA